MSFGNLFKSIFTGAGADKAPAAEPEQYKNLQIEAAPIYEDGKYRTAGYISGERDGEPRRVRFIRADQHGDQQAAIEHSLTKARQIIDEQGAALLDKPHL